MKKSKKLACLSFLACGMIVLSSCQAAPINAVTTITDRNGAGSKELHALLLVDGSVQISPDSSFEGDTTYYYIDDPKMENINITPKVGDLGGYDRVNMIKDGYFTNPNKLENPTAIWEEFNTFVGSLIPEGFEFNVRTVQSDDWNDDYMTNIPDSMNMDIKAWKGYVYTVSYSWENTQDYIDKTKQLMGESYEVSELYELENNGTPWAQLIDNGDETFTWKEAFLVNFWSVYDIANQAMDSEYFNREALGADYRVETESAFSCSLQSYKVGEGEVTNIKVNNKNGVDENLNPTFIEAKGHLPKAESPINTPLIICIVLGVLGLGIVGFIVYKVLKNKKGKKENTTK